MRQILALALLGALGVTGACRKAAGNADEGRAPVAVTTLLDPRAEGVLVWFDEALTEDARLRVARESGAVVLHRYARLPALFVRGELEALRTASGVRAVAPVAPWSAAKSTTVRLSEGARIAVLGPGVNPRARVRLAETCFTVLPLGCDDPTGVGTQAARDVLAARPDAVIAAVRVLDEDLGSDATLLAGLDWVAGMDKPVAEVSFPATDSKVVEEALRWMRMTAQARGAATGWRPRRAAP
jgi:hypothetical protein